MKRNVILLLAIFALLLTIPAAIAGEGHGGCKASTQECLNKMAANLQHKGIIGVEGEWDEAIKGYRIDNFIKGSTAESAGIIPGDVLLAINGIALSDGEATHDDDANRKPGAMATVTVLRNGKKKSFDVTLIGLTKEQVAKIIGAHMLKHAEVKLAMAD